MGCEATNLRARQHASCRKEPLLGRLECGLSAITIRADAALILRFIRELAIYEKAEHEMLATETDIRATLCSGRGSARALVCSIGGEDAGFAAYFFNYSTWQGRKGLYLEDLYLTLAHRGAGAGMALLQHLARTAMEQDCGRFE